MLSSVVTIEIFIYRMSWDYWGGNISEQKEVCGHLDHAGAFQINNKQWLWAAWDPRPNNVRQFLLWGQLAVIILSLISWNGSTRSGLLNGAMLTGFHLGKNCSDWGSCGVLSSVHQPKIYLWETKYRITASSHQVLSSTTIWDGPSRSVPTMPHFSDSTTLRMPMWGSLVGV